MTLYISNFRAGFATNSSSSHSVVIIPDDKLGSFTHDDQGYFGNNDFVLMTTESKMRYLAAQLFFEGMSEDSRKRFADYFKTYLPNIDTLMGRDDFYVDHQSSYPKFDFDNRFAKHLTDIFLSNNVVILGGGDDGSYYSIPEAKPVSLCEELKDNYALKIKRDRDYTVIFNTESGNKLRISDKPAPYLKAETPELVDLKITNFCEFACSFCYQASTPKGKHASLDEIKKISDLLKKLNVLEVAIGGGEPTTHPYFAEIIETLAPKSKYDNDGGLVVNFTTFTDKWLEDDRLTQVVDNRVKAIGVSCQTVDSLKVARNIKHKFKWGPKVMVQHVLGASTLNDTAEFLSRAFAEEFPVLLLGFKEVGFGKGHERFDDEYVETFLKLAVEQGGHTVSLSVDTALVDRYPDICKALGAPEALVTSPEGKFSCYIDAVKAKMGPSSYVPFKTMDALTLDQQTFKEVFARY